MKIKLIIIILSIFISAPHAFASGTCCPSNTTYSLLSPGDNLTDVFGQTRTVANIHSNSFQFIAEQSCQSSTTACGFGYCSELPRYHSILVEKLQDPNDVDWVFVEIGKSCEHLSN